MYEIYLNLPRKCLELGIPLTPEANQWGFYSTRLGSALLGFTRFSTIVCIQVYCPEGGSGIYKVLRYTRTVVRGRSRSTPYNHEMYVRPLM